MTAPHIAQGMQPDAGWFSEQIADLQRQINELRSARSSEATTVGAGGITVTDGGAIVILDASSNEVARFDATGLDVAQQLAVDGTLDVTGAAVISGTLSLPAGIIGNDALANPVSADTFTGAAALSLTFTGSLANYITKTVAVPTGFSQAVVMAVATAASISGGATTSSINSRVVINGNAGPAGSSLATQGAFATSALSIKLTGLSGGSITVNAQASDASGNMLAGTGSCSLSGFAIFLR